MNIVYTRSNHKPLEVLCEASEFYDQASSLFWKNFQATVAWKWLDFITSVCSFQNCVPIHSFMWKRYSSAAVHFKHTRKFRWKRGKYDWNMISLVLASCNLLEESLLRAHFKRSEWLLKVLESMSAWDWEKSSFLYNIKKCLAGCFSLCLKRFHTAMFK